MVSRMFKLVPRRFNRIGHPLIWLLTCLLTPSTLRAQEAYEVGAIVDDVALTEFGTGRPMRLSDYAGKIIYLEWFYWW